MAQTRGAPLKERKRLEQQKEAAILHVFTSRNKALEASKRDKKQKKRSLGQLRAMLNLSGIEAKMLREPHTYIPRSYNLDKQLTGMLIHVFVEFPVPAFLYQCCLPAEDKLAKMHGMFRQWFVTLAQGGSFSKLVKHTMTSKEAHVFLSAPSGRKIHENVWWARMKVAGLPSGVIDRLIERIFQDRTIDDPDGRLAEVIQFYARYHGEMSRVTFGEVTDFIVWKLQNDREFRLKGRTIGSVVRLTNEWHVLMQKAKLGVRVEWKGFGYPEWLLEEKNRIWVVQELRDNRELMNEGRKQKHCVYGYVQWCSTGHSSIFSMRVYRKIVGGYTEDGQLIWDRSCELDRVTIEVRSNRTIAQVRGLQNRMATDDEKKVLRAWAGEKGFTIQG
jgi:hypothetical protein